MPSVAGPTQLKDRASLVHGKTVPLVLLGKPHLLPKGGRVVACTACANVSRPRVRPNTSLKRRRATARHLAREAPVVYHALRGPGAAPLRAA
jgi:hypothetical protein